jgi:hypothetical protein
MKLEKKRVMVFLYDECMKGSCDGMNGRMMTKKNLSYIIKYPK